MQSMNPCHRAEAVFGATAPIHGLNVSEYIQKLFVVFRIHDAEPHELSVKAFKGGAVADHHFFFDRRFEDVK